MKRYLSLFLAIIMVVSMLPVSALNITAETTTESYDEETGILTVQGNAAPTTAIDDGWHWHTRHQHFAACSYHNQIQSGDIHEHIPACFNRYDGDLYVLYPQDSSTMYYVRRGGGPNSNSYTGYTYSELMTYLNGNTRTTVYCLSNGTYAELTRVGNNFYFGTTAPTAEDTVVSIVDGVVTTLYTHTRLGFGSSYEGYYYLICDYANSTTAHMHDIDTCGTPTYTTYEKEPNEITVAIEADNIPTTGAIIRLGAGTELITTKTITPSMDTDNDGVYEVQFKTGDAKTDGSGDNLIIYEHVYYTVSTTYATSTTTYYAGAGYAPIVKGHGYTTIVPDNTSNRDGNYNHIDIKLAAEYTVRIDGVRYTMDATIDPDSFDIYIGSEKLDLGDFNAQTEDGHIEYTENINLRNYTITYFDDDGETFFPSNIYYSCRLYFDEDQLPEVLKNILESDDNGYYIDLEKQQYTGLNECTNNNGMRRYGNTGSTGGIDLYVVAYGVELVLTKGYLAIEKTVVDEDGKEVTFATEADTPVFEYTVHNDDGTLLTFELVTEDENGDEPTTVTYKYITSSTDDANVANVTKIPVAAGTQVMLSELPQDIYTVTEIQKEGYIIKDIDGASSTTTYSKDYTVEVKTDAEIPVASFTNTKLTAKSGVKMIKTAKIYDSDGYETTVPDGRAFPNPQVIITDKDGNTVWDGMLETNSGDYLYLTPYLTPGQTYTVTELLSDADNYTHEAEFSVFYMEDGVKKVIEASPKDGVHAVEFTVPTEASGAVISIDIFNSYKEIPPTGDLTVTKQFGTDSVITAANFPKDQKITIRLTDGNTLVHEAQVGWDSDKQQYVWSVEFTDIVPGEYLLYEIVNTAEINGYTLAPREYYETTNNTSVDLVAKNYVITIAEGGTQSAVIVNTYSVSKGNLTITKDFDANSDIGKDYFTQNNKTVEIKVEGPAYSTPLTFTLPYDDNGTATWTKELTDLTVGEYTVTETVYDVVDGYTATTPVYSVTTGKVTVEKDKTATFTITNKYTQDFGTVKVTKEFDAPEGMTKPTEITVSIKKGDAVVDTLTLNADNDWTATSKALPVDSYTVVENTDNAAVSGYTLAVTGNNATVNVEKDKTATVTITNKYTQDKGTITVTKQFEGLPNDKRPLAITVKIMDGNTTVETLTLNSANGWSASVSLPAGTYTVTEDKGSADVSGYTLDAVTGNEASVTVTKGSENSVTIKNTYSLNTGTITVAKTFNESVSTVRPTSVTVYIKNGNTVVDTLTLNAGNSWTATSKDLPVGEYTVVEDTEAAKLTGYDLEVTGNDATVTVKKDTTTNAALVNKYVPDAGTVTITKEFSIANGETVTLPESVTVKITDSNGNEVETVTLSANTSPAWTKTLTLAPGTYTVEEVNVTATDENHKWIVSYNGDVYDADADGKFEVNVADDGTYEINIVNHYEKLETVYVMFEISKDILVGEYAAQPTGATTFKFNILPQWTDGTTVYNTLPEGTTIHYNKQDITNSTLTNGINVTVNGSEKATVEAFFKGNEDQVAALLAKDFKLIITEANTENTDWSYSDAQYQATLIKKDDNTYAFKTEKIGENNTLTEEAVVFENEYVKPAEVSLIITKNFASGSSVTADNFPANEQITVKVADKEYYLTKDNNFTVTVTGLTAGVAYTVEEVDAEIEGHTLVNPGQQVTVILAADGTDTVVFVNNYVRNTITVNLTKSFAGDLTTLPAGQQITFTFTNVDNADEKYQLVLPTAEGSWTGTVQIPAGGYHVTESGAEVEGYAVIPAGLFTLYKTEGTANIFVTNTYTRDAGKLNIAKVFSGDLPADLYPEVTFRFTNEQGTNFDFTLPYEGAWTREITLPTGTYTLTELNAEVNGYTHKAPEAQTVTVAKDAAAATVTLVNEYSKVFVPEDVEVTVNKYWNDNGNLNRPAFIVAVLLQNGNIYDSVVLSDLNGWTHTWEGLSGLYNWSVDEHAVAEGYIKRVYKVENNTYNIVNTMISAPTYESLTVNKVWLDYNNPERPTAIRVQLYRDGEAYGSTVLLSKNNGWTYTWDKLDDSYTWTVDEVNVPDGYEKNVSVKGNTVTITNTFIENEVDVSVTKLWIDNGENRPYAVTVQLYCNGQPYGQTVQLSEINNWTYTWEGLDGDMLWVVDEVNTPEGYTKSLTVNGHHFVIVNTRDEVPESGTADDTTAKATYSLASIVFALTAVSALVIVKNRKKAK